MDPNQFNQTLASYAPPAPAQATQPQVTAPTQPTQHGNWFTHLLPTIGGIVGGIGGELINPFGGGIAGAALLSGAGKAIENGAENQSLGNGVLSNAVMGGVGQGIGGVLGKVGGAAMGALGGKSAGLADNLVKGQFSRGMLSGEDANLLRTAGMTDMRQIPGVSQIITGPTGALSNGVKTALGSTNTGVDISGLDKMATNWAAEQGLKDTSITSIGHNLTNSMNNMAVGDVSKIVAKDGTPVYSYAPGALSNAMPENVFAQTQKMEQLASQAYTKGIDKMTGQVVDADQYGQYKVYKQLADELENRAFGTNGANPLPLVDEAKQQIINELGGIKDINPAVHAHMVDQINNAQTIQELRPLQSLWVRASQAGQATAKAADRMGGTTAGGAVSGLPIAGAVAGGPHGMLAGVAAQALRSPTVDRAAIPIVEKGGALLSQLGKSKAPGLLGGAMGTGIATSNNLINGTNSDTVGATMQNNNNMGGVTGAPTGQPGGLTRDDLITLALYSPSAFNSLMPNDAQKQNVSNATSAEAALTGLGEAPHGGILSNIEGSMGLGRTGEYQRQAASAAEQVSKALPGTDPAAIQKQLTDYMAGGANITDAIQALMTRLHAVSQSNQSAGMQSLLGLGSAAPQGIMGQVPAVQ